jgi:tRNA nucleotidyltransferase/poly(A) polymerase
MEMFEVGGCVRDEIIGVKSKDIDFTVVLDESEVPSAANSVTPVDPFAVMVRNLKEQGFEIFLETPEFLTARARFPGKGYTVEDDMFDRPYDKYKGMTADFVLARRESQYTDGRRPDAVQVGTLEDDLNRRDFTMNAIAKATDGSLIDPHNGVADIEQRIVRAVGDPVVRLREDALRALRAVRFAVTKGFRLDPALEWAMQNVSVLTAIENNISDERIKDELSKMFRFDTVESLVMLNRFPALTRAAFSGSVSLDSTMKTKGRGK